MADAATLTRPGMAVDLGAGAGHNSPPVLEVVNLKKHFPVKKGLLRRTVGQVYAVDDISFTIGAGETLGMVGESVCDNHCDEEVAAGVLAIGRRGLGCVVGSSAGVAEVAETVGDLCR